MSACGVDEVVVVTGHAREAVEEQVRRFIVTLVHNDAYAEGQDGSVRVGLAALQGQFDAVFVALADQPLIGGGDLTELIGAFKKRPGGHSSCRWWTACAAIPSCSTRKRRRASWRAKRRPAAARLIDREPALVHAHQTSNTRFVTDLDTVEDVEALAKNTGWKLEFPAAEAVR